MYLHVLACLLNLTFSFYSPKMYLVQIDGTYKNNDGTLYKDENGNVVKNIKKDDIFGETRYFRDQEWNRKQEGEEDW